jgi:hypothetical protein
VKFGFSPRFAASRRRETKKYSPINQGDCQFEKDAAPVSNIDKGKRAVDFSPFSYKI